MQRSLPALLLLSLLFVACQPTDPAERALEKAIKFHGGESYDSFSLEFEFRDMRYLIQRDGGTFEYIRIQKDSTGTEIRDVLTNTDTYRTIGGERQSVPDSLMDKYKYSVNSVAYFLLLPQPLQDPAVQKEYIGVVDIKGKKYDKIKVFFAQEGGGKDHDDVFVYWFDQEDGSMDYLAYLYHVNESGMRFREAYNPQRVGGMLMQDYINFAPKDSTLAVTDENLLSMDKLYLGGELKQLSRIENKNFILH
ncbi:DUF6503 family protein [Arundinibacter roseus]|uniref:Deoxyribose-phosphate aldolase n=1 Tax=Arundinibacter roseus TaxID=2070510 RepID=A0A4R4JZN0_9BACT|nr:DUF6503 family protein [Arundinibacter roseus]TDB60374.1 hypothetical protein EZE20_20795 [Arundinibacter roseus]